MWLNPRRLAVWIFWSLEFMKLDKPKGGHEIALCAPVTFGNFCSVRNVRLGHKYAMRRSRRCKWWLSHGFLLRICHDTLWTLNIFKRSRAWGWSVPGYSCTVTEGSAVASVVALIVELALELLLSPSCLVFRLVWAFCLFLRREFSCIKGQEWGLGYSPISWKIFIISSTATMTIWAIPQFKTWAGLRRLSEY